MQAARTFLHGLFKFAPTRETATALVTGCAVIGLSLAMLLFDGARLELFANIILRDVLMVLLIGFCFPLYYVTAPQRQNLRFMGITTLKLKRSLIISIVLALVLLAVFIKESAAPPGFNYYALCAVVYIFAAGVFEVVFFYGFLRCYFEKAFGVIPAIILTAAFYSLHHAGFQPEFGKLFWVGVMYTAVFYTTRNLAVVFPFFWAVGALWDVLVNSSAGLALRNTTTLIIGLALLAFMAAYTIVLFKLRAKHF